MLYGTLRYGLMKLILIVSCWNLCSP